MDHVFNHDISRLIGEIEKDGSLWMVKQSDYCVSIYPKTLTSIRAVCKIDRIKKLVLEGKYNGVIIKNFYHRYNIHGLTICPDNDRNHSYKEIIKVIEK